MKADIKDEIENKNTNEEESNEDFLQIGNLNINNEVDIKENPKKHIANTKKKQILKNSLNDNSKEISENTSLMTKINLLKQKKEG